MDKIGGLFQAHIDIVFFVYGLAFVVLGIAILAQPKRESGFGIALLFWLLAAFGLTHGINEFLDMWVIIKGKGPVIDLVRWAFLVSSYIFLFEFGRRLISATQLRRIGGVWHRNSVFVICALIFATAFMSGDFWLTGSVLARYLLGFTGGLCTGLGFIFYYRTNSDRLDRMGLKKYFMLTGASFIFYGATGGLIVPAAGFFPASFLNHESFYAAVGIPVQVFRGLCAVLIALAVSKILTMFHVEITNKLEEDLSLLNKSQNSLRQLHRFTKTAFDSLNEAIAIVNVRDFTIAGANRNFLDEYGFREESEAIGKTCHEVTHKQTTHCTPPYDICPLLKTLETGLHATEEHIHTDYYGNKKYVEVSTTPIRDDSANIVQVIHVSRDITQKKLAEQSLLKNEERFQTLFNTSQDGIYWTDSSGVFTLINEAGARILGHRSPEEIIGRKANDYWRDPADRDEFIALIRREKRVSAYHIPAKRVDGTPLDIEATVRIVEDEKGIFLGIEGILRDVTQHMLYQKELKQKNEQMSALFGKVEAVKKEWECIMDSTDDMIALISSKETIMRCNKVFKSFFGNAYEGIIGKNWKELFKQYGLQYEGNPVHGSELYHPESFRWFVLSINPFEGHELQTEYVLTIHDQTDMKNLTESLSITNAEIEQNKIKLQDALEELTFLINEVTNKKDFSVRFQNPNLKICYEEKGCKSTDCPCYGKDEERCWQIAGTYCGGKVQGVFAEKFGNCAECDIFKSATSDPIYQIGENFNNMMHILEIQHKELEDAYNDLKVAQSRILQQEKMASIGQLAAGVAHEINNPTGFIMSNLGTLQKYSDKLTEFIKAQAEAVRPEQAEAVEKRRRELKVDYIIEDLRNLVTESLDGAERIRKIVQDLKSFSRVDEAENKMADINSGIDATVNIVWNELKYKATVKKEYGDIPHTRCNPGQLNQVFMNMLVNAAHAIEKQGEITIRTRSEEGNILVSISDTGKGISPENLNRIFEPFFTTKDVGKGTGLGLSIAYEIIKKHNGEILVESEVGKGTTFTVVIPVIGGENE